MFSVTVQLCSDTPQNRTDQANWGWRGMWLSEDERAKVLTDTLAGFLAASPEEIRDAALLMIKRSSEYGG